MLVDIFTHQEEKYRHRQQCRTIVKYDNHEVISRVHFSAEEKYCLYYKHHVTNPNLDSGIIFLKDYKWIQFDINCFLLHKAKEYKTYDESSYCEINGIKKTTNEIYHEISLKDFQSLLKVNIGFIRHAIAFSKCCYK